MVRGNNVRRQAQIVLGVARHRHHGFGLIIGFLLVQALIQPFLLLVVEQVRLILHRPVAGAEQQIHTIGCGSLLHCNVSVGRLTGQLLPGALLRDLCGQAALVAIRQRNVVVHQGQPPVGRIHRLHCILAGAFAHAGRSPCLAFSKILDQAHPAADQQAQKPQQGQADQCKQNAVAQDLLFAAALGGGALAGSGRLTAFGFHGFSFFYLRYKIGFSSRQRLHSATISIISHPIGDVNARVLPDFDFLAIRAHGRLIL